LTYVQPVKDAFSYRLAIGGPDKEPAPSDGAAVSSAPAALRCDRVDVNPGERVVVQGKQRHEVLIPTDARPGQRLWLEFENGWIDFTIAPLAQAGQVEPKLAPR
jgi:hypothetical protein